MDRLQQNLSHTLTQTAGGTPTAPSATIKYSDGTTLLTATPTISGNTLSIALPSANTAVLDKYTVEWTYTVSGQVWRPKSHFEIVGAYYFSIAEARAFDGGTVLNDATKYPDQDIVNAREYAEETLESLCGVAFVPRGRRVTLNGTGTRELILPDHRIRTIVSGSVGGTALTSAELTDLKLYEYGILYRAAGWQMDYRNVSILYEHGHDQPPERIKRAALILTRHRLVPSNIDERVTAFTDESGTRTFSTPTQNRPTGFPEVDAAVAQYSEKVPAIA